MECAVVHRLSPLAVRDRSNEITPHRSRKLAQPLRPIGAFYTSLRTALLGFAHFSDRAITVRRRLGPGVQELPVRVEEVA